MKSLLLLCSFISIHTLFGQNLIKNSFSDNPATLTHWNVSNGNCPIANYPGWKPFTAGLISGYPSVWTGSAFFAPDVMTSGTASLSQMVNGLVPAAGNKVELSMDVIIGEARNFDASNNPVEFINDKIVLEVWLGGTLYATIETPGGWYSALGGSYGKCIVRYFNSATSVNYIGGNIMSNISTAAPNGQMPYLNAVKNSNWDISIPWECGKTSSALLEFKVYSPTYSATCTTSNTTNLDDIALDNVLIKKMSIPNTPALAQPNLYSTSCGQTSFNLLPALGALPACPVAEGASLEYKFYSDANLTTEITSPSNYSPILNEQMVYVVLANKVTEPNILTVSSTKRELKITKNNLITAGLVGNDLTFMCSNTTAGEIKNLISAIGVTGSSITYNWEVALNNIAGPYNPASGSNDNAYYFPTGITTPNETITNYYFKRTAKSTLNGLTCSSATSTVLVIVDPCAPIAYNHVLENVFNPGGITNINVPLNLFSGTTSVANRNISAIKLTKFPKNCTSLTLINTAPTSSQKSAKTNATTVYCGTPAADGCVGTPFPNSGITLLTNTNGTPLNSTILVDPIANGSFQIDLSYVAVDNFGFNGTNANASMVLLANIALPLSLKSFEVSKTNENILDINWKTEKEKNFSHFELEQAKNNDSFKNIIKILPNESQHYNHIVNNIDNGIYYFRLKMVDLDGEFSYSAIKSIKVQNENNNAIVIRKNPAEKIILADLKLETGNYLIDIFDTSGHKVSSISKQIITDEFNLQLNNSPLKSGMYFVRTLNIDSHKTLTTKVLVD
jgi:Secretion system C-terminal sorting domain